VLDQVEAASLLADVVDDFVSRLRLFLEGVEVVLELRPGHKSEQRAFEEVCPFVEATLAHELLHLLECESVQEHEDAVCRRVDDEARGVVVEHFELAPAEHQPLLDLPQVPLGQEDAFELASDYGLLGQHADLPGDHEQHGR